MRPGFFFGGSDRSGEKRGAPVASFGERGRCHARRRTMTIVRAITLAALVLVTTRRPRTPAFDETGIMGKRQQVASNGTLGTVIDASGDAGSPYSLGPLSHAEAKCPSGKVVGERKFGRHHRARRRVPRTSTRSGCAARCPDGPEAFRELTL